MTVAPPVAVTGRVWTVEWSDRGVGRPPTMNDHRTLHHQARARVDKTWRRAFHLLTRQGKVPHLECIRVEVTPLHTDRRTPQDCAACAPAAKAAVDGVVDAGVIDDDDPAHLQSILFLQPDVCGRDGLRILIVEVTP